MGYLSRFKQRVTDPMGRKPYIQKPLKEIHFHKNEDGSLDTTPRVLLVFPVFTHVLPQPFVNFVTLALHAGHYLPTYKFDVMLCERELIHSGMNRAAEVCIKNPWYIGMIAFDDDCLPPSNSVTRLVAHYEHGHHVVAGMGFMRSYPHTTTVGKNHEMGPLTYEKEGEQRGFEWLDDITQFKPDDHGLIQVDFCGMPVMFMSRKVIADMKPPHFQHHDDTGATMTHDIYFCNKARDMGYKIEVDVTLECGHVGPAPIITSKTRAIARGAVEDYKESEAVKV